MGGGFTSPFFVYYRKLELSEVSIYRGVPKWTGFYNGQF